MAEPVRNYPQFARDILEVVGGSSNVSNATRCATRLRLVLRETPPGAKDTVMKLPGVITVVENSGQFQVVIGAHVGEVYDEFINAAYLEDVAEDGDGPKQSVLNRVIVHLDLGLERLVLASCNGAAIVDAETEEVICHRTLDPELVTRVLDLVERLGLAAMTPLGGVVHVTSADGYNVEEEARGNGMRVEVAPRFETIGEPIHKVLVCADPADLAPAVATFRAELAGLAEVALSAPFYLEVTPAGVDKGSGLADYCTARGVDLARVVAFGDNENDLPMLRTAGTGVAMGNAVDHVKAEADHVTTSNDDDGIALALGL